MDGFQILKLTRENWEGGGLAIGILEQLEPVLIFSGSDEVELMVVELKVGNENIRLINGPQEGDPLEKSLSFYVELEKEIESAMNSGKKIIIEMDANAKLGKEIVKGHQHNVGKWQSFNSRSSNVSYYFELGVLEVNHIIIVRRLSFAAP